MRVLIANRGEVAVRIIRACEERGFTSILLHSTPDKKTPAYRMANETIEIDGATPLETYLDISKVLSCALKTKAQLLHPGFGFLSENPDFVEQIEKAGITFVGPTSQAIRKAGNKIQAKELAMKAGVPVVPSYTGSGQPPEIMKAVKKIGFPCIIKAASGGGGKGMKVVRQEQDFFELYASAQREAKNAFGSDIVFIEKYVERPRHIEVQIFFDSHGNGIHLFERECSIQRRHQKIFEETPSLALSADLRDKITTAALDIARAAGYTNAGTVEFLLDQDGQFYFMELNTRLQVEHTVTEEVCGIDLVALQFETALGHTLKLKQEDITQRGHAIEVRIYAEDPAREFLPSIGEILKLHLPLGPRRRFDFGYEEGDEVTPFYDPMIGKIIAWGQDRKEAIQRLHAILDETIIFGVHTNIEFLKDVIKKENFIKAQLSTRFLEEEYKRGFSLPPLTATQNSVAQSLAQLPPIPQGSTKSGGRFVSPWNTGSWNK